MCFKISFWCNLYREFNASPMHCLYTYTSNNMAKWLLPVISGPCENSFYERSQGEPSNTHSVQTFLVQDMLTLYNCYKINYILVSVTYVLNLFISRYCKLFSNSNNVKGTLYVFLIVSVHYWGMIIKKKEWHIPYYVILYSLKTYE